MTNRLLAWREDAGASLIIALVIITTVALVTGALLTHGWTNVRATITLRGVAGTAYASDAAAKVAINTLRLGADAPGWVAPSFPGVWGDWVYTNNADGTGCFGVTSSQAPQNALLLSNVYPGAGDQASASSARVECSQVPGTGIFSGIGIQDPNPTDSFARALTTVGNSGALQGITLKPLGAGNQAPMPLRGGVASESYIDVDNGALVTDGYIWAEGSCTGQMVAAEVKCSSPGTVPVPDTPDSPLTAVPTFRDPSDYTGTCQFPAGFYNNAADLSTAVNSCSVARFAPGPYYFDFRDEDHSGQNVWTISTKVIGGESTGSTTIPGGCRSPIGNTGVDGVQFVFGGTSRVQLSDTAQVELCGKSNGGDAPMTLYQQQTGTTSASTSLTDVSANTVIGQTGGKFNTGVVTPSSATLPAAVANVDASNVTFTMASNAKNEAGLDLRDFPGLSDIPAGSDVTSAQVRVNYTKTSTKNLTVTVKDQTPDNLVVSAPDGSGWGSADVAAQLRAMLEDGAFDPNKPTLELRLVGASKDEALTINAVKLSVTYVPPSLRSASAVTFIGAPGGNFQGRFVVHGATFAPQGYVDLVPGSSNQALVAFRWGLVALGVSFKAQPPQTFGYPLVSIPDAGTGLGSRVVVVDLKIYVCVEQVSCGSGGTYALKTRVMITDPPYTGNPAAPEPGRRKIEVLSWSEQR
jgi:hypothetical protein